MGKDKEAKIGVYTNLSKYFTQEVSHHKIKKIYLNDKVFLGFSIRDVLNKKGIEKCVLFPLKNEGNFPATKYELEVIGTSISFNLNGVKPIEIKINEEIYFGKNKPQKPLKV